MSDKYPGGFVTANAPAGFSVAFNGSTDYIQTPASANLALGSGDFTIEFWMYMNAKSAYMSACGLTGTSTQTWQIILDASGNSIGFYSQVPNAFIVTTSTVPAINTWYHVAFVRSGTTMTVYLNGVNNGSATDANNYSYASNLFTIGNNAQLTAGRYWNGYISNMRIIKGTALYTTAFTPPTQLFPITNTQLLTCQSPTFVDNSNNAFAITAFGSSKTSNFTPFAGYTGFNPALGAAAGGVWTLDEAAYYQNNRQWPIYDPYFNQTTLMLHGNGTNGAQNNTFLDSSSSPLTITRNGNTTQGSFSPFSQTGWSYNGTAGAYCTLNNADYSLGTGDFTVETWMYCVDDSTYSYANICSAPSNPNFTVGFGAGGGSGARQLYVEYGGSATGIGSNMSGYLNRWTHIAVVRQSGTVTAYQNGVSLGSISKSASVGSTASLYLLRNTGDTAMDFRGYISNYRITKSAVYTSNFTPSTAPLTAVTSTVLLTFQDNRFVDNSALRATVTPAGTASVQAFSPFVPAYITPTTYSNYFNGSSYITAPQSTNLDLGSANWTIEAWVNATSNSGNRRIINKQNASNSWIFRLNSSGSGSVAYFEIDTVAIVTGAIVIPNNTWAHVAVVRNSNTVTIYVNGVADTSATYSGTPSAPNAVTAIGAYAGGPSEYFSGCISNARFVKGTAVYTAAFTPPTAPLTAITNTQLLTCQSSTFIDNSSNAFTITATGTTYPVTSPTPFPAKVDTTTLNSAYSTSLIGGSAYFDGTGDYLTLPANAAFNFNSGDFTLETWLYMPNFSAFQEIFSQGSSNFQGIGIYITTAGKVNLDLGNGSSWFASLLSASSLKLNSWNHVAIVRQSTTYTIYLNGVADASTTSATYPSNASASSSYIGVYGPLTSQPFTGYMAGYRLVKGTAVYTSSFAPPLAPPTAVTNTQLLLNYTNGAIFDNTTKNVLETVGNAQISTTQSKWGGSSMLFDGSGDVVKAPYTPNMDFGTGDFTIECWVYTTNVSPGYSQTVLARQGSSGGVIWIVQILNGGTSRIVLAGSVVCAGTTVAANTWTHLAFTRSGTSLRAFNNGVLITTVTDSTSLSGTQVLTVGAQSDAAESFIGYIDDVRITKGYARYTTNFTPPTSQLQDQ